MAVKGTHRFATRVAHSAQQLRVNVLRVLKDLTFDHLRRASRKLASASLKGRRSERGVRSERDFPP
eukprot:6195695-Pleurochrysis_carterae.AAC.1